MSAPLPENEKQRLEALRQYDVLDTAPEQAFEDLTLLAAQICEVPMAMVSLVDENRQWFKSKLGLAASETPRDIAFCAHTILQADQVLEVSDAQTDPRFAQSALVTSEPRVRFYAGAPLITPDGHALGALCVMDQRPRRLTPDQLNALKALSRRVVAQLELRHQAQLLAKKEQEAVRMLQLAEKSRRALLGVLEDEQQATASLRESEERFREMAASIDEVFWMTDTAKGHILYVSPAYEKIWGRRGEELYGSPGMWAKAIVPEDRDRVVAAVLAKQSTGEYREEYRIARPDGSIRWIFDRAFPVRNAAGEVCRVVGVAVDITERKQLEEQFLRAQRMEAIGTLAGGVAHDLNNILAPVIMASGLLEEKLTDPHDLALLAMMGNSAQRGADIIRQLLMFSRGVAGERVIVQLRHLIKDMYGIMRETFPRDIALVEAAVNNLRPVSGDATQLHQVLMNLCVNARDAMPAGGKLTLRADNVELTQEQVAAHPPARAGWYVRISVQDTGHGIPTEIVGRIFDPFFTTKDLGKGTGLGLSTVLGIVKSHAGFLAVRSVPQEGTTFDVYLPAIGEAPESPIAATNALRPMGKGELILVVDDETEITTTAHLMLEKHGYRVMTAANGREALARFLEQQDAIKVVLTDLMMPVMGGVALIRALRSMQPNLHIIATTGMGEDFKRDELKELRVSETLEKPYFPEVLLGTVRRVLDRA